MKNYYASPEVKVYFVVPAKCVLASGEDLRTRSYGEESGEDSKCFWE